MRLFVYSTLSDSARTYLRQQLPPATEVLFRTELSAAEQGAAFQSAELLMGNPPPAWLAPGPPPGLRFWQIDSAGFDQYAGLQVPFPVANVGDFFAWPCAETIVAGILAHYRHLDELAVLQHQKKWVGAPLRRQLRLLRGQRVIILGAGAIGLAVQEQLSGFRCQVRLLARTDARAQLHSKDELRAALPDTDLVINCLPGSAKRFFSADLIQAMRPGSVYASVGRGTTTDEPALIRALQAGQLGGAVLDVTAQEPLPPEHPLWALPQVLLTQHTAGGQPHEDEGKVDILLSNLARLQRGEQPENLVELARGY
ncbi:D-2-hydroxyacid dehydrogenase [Hymenobacter jeollabukensis]|uniref:D-2-hydroxyacid dehydrogenase n=1 Tax=Hymenobacter jeollabukensis TaxID=2025313 RepID=A0A5R8WRD4_9BACT|nr:D-2-hydroxyacid dehydrogenase [Hymenobacter jeollabukensis]TLM93308.1 D-2-hydroxyacid dehydrogenase [Hymenobacter jeollabukensis]